MSSTNFKMFFLIMISGLIFQGCSKDELDVDLTNSLVSNDQNRGPNGSSNSANNIAQLDNDILKDWTTLMLELERYATGMRPNASARAFAYIYLAAYETAAPGMDRDASLSRQLNGLDIRDRERARNINWELALNACLADVMDHFILNIPDDLRSEIGELELTLEDDLSEDLSNRLVDDSKDWGTYVAKQIIKYSQTDTRAEEQILVPQPLSYEPPTGDGFWTYSADPERALFPYWGSVRTFVIAPEETTTVPPIPYSENENSPYFQQMLEAYTANNEARAADGEQLWIAEFWSDDVEELTFSPPAREYAIANQLIEQYDMNLEKALGLYMKLGLSLNDAAVATWKYKYDYMVMRPNVFIHEFIDPDFQTNLYRLVWWPNPSFPGYPSGHSTFASAAAGIFIDYFGNQIEFTDRSHEGRTEFRGAPRSFKSFEEMAAENAFSRIPLGVHMRMDCTEGLRLGYEIADAVNKLRTSRSPDL